MIDPLCNRLRSVLAQLALDRIPHLPRRALNVGCGMFPAAAALQMALPGWALYGIDLDRKALLQAQEDVPDLRLVQADARWVGRLFRATFGLVLVRHPDVFRRSAWAQVFAALPARVAPGGALVVTLYAAEEVERVRSFGLPLTPFDPAALAPPGLSGDDRYVLAWVAGESGRRARRDRASEVSRW